MLRRPPNVLFWTDLLSLRLHESQAFVWVGSAVPMPNFSTAAMHQDRQAVFVELSPQSW